MTSWNIVYHSVIPVVLIRATYCCLSVVSLGADSRQFANFVITGGTVGCHYDNLRCRCRQWQQGRRVDELMPTACFCILYHGKQLHKLCFSALPSLQTLFWMCILMCKCDAVWENKMLDLTTKGSMKSMTRLNQLFSQWSLTLLCEHAQILLSKLSSVQSRH